MSNLRNKFWDVVNRVKFFFTKKKTCDSCGDNLKYNTFHTIHYMALDELNQKQDIYKMKVCDHCAMALEVVEKLQGEARKRE